MTLLIFIVVISLLVFVHELGHFLAARRLGVKVEEFGFGFPPKMLGIRRGQTTYSLNWIPFGGFVRLKGETPGASNDPDSFAVQSRLKRFIILAAGVFMNYLLTIFLLTIGFSVGIPAAQDDQASISRLQHVKPQIVSLQDQSPAAIAGLKVGDTMLRANDTPITDADSLRQFEQELGDQPFRLVISRGGQERTLTLDPETREGEVRIGVAILNVGILSYSFPESLWQGVRATVNVTGQIFSSFGTLLKNLVVTGKVGPDLSGPVGIVVLTGQAYSLGFGYLLQFVALLSATLAVVNFFPLPALDGGRALFVLIEAVRRKAVDQRIESLIHAVGFYVLIALVLLVSLHDVQRFGLGQRIAATVRTVFGN